MGANQEQTPQTDIRPPGGVTIRAVVLGIVLIFIINFLVSRMELVTGRRIAGGIPPMPAVAIIAALVALYPLARRWMGEYFLSRREILVLYVLLLIAVPFCGTFGVRSFLPRLSVLQYYATPENDFAEYAEMIPNWWAPESNQVIVDMYEGLSGTGVPWSAWAQPLLAWTLFFVAWFIATICLMSVMSKQWSEREHLPYPLVQLPIEMVASTDSSGALVGFFTNPLTWVGIALAALYNALNIGHAVNPAVPAIPLSQNMSALFTERPWNAVNPVVISSFLGFYGFAYFVSQELLLSIVVCTLAAKLTGVVGAAAGYEPPGWPYMQEQSAGGYLVMAVLIVWVARGHLSDVFRKAFFADTRIDDANEPIPYRLAVIGLLAGAVFFVGWSLASNMSLKIVIPFFLIVMCYGLTYGRIRAEVGVSHDFVYPYRLPQRTILYAVGSRGVMAAGGQRTMVLFTVLSFLSRFHPVQMMSAYQTDAFQIGKTGRLNQRALAGVIVLIFVIGLVLAFWGHFTTFYDIGVNVLEGNSWSADWRTADTRGAYQTMVSYIENPTTTDWQHTGAIIVGGLITLALAFARTQWLRFPIHPLGYVVALSYGPATVIWFPFFVVWLVKAAVLKIGGMRLFRRLVPLFIGLVVGHFILGGIVWSAISLLLPMTLATRYQSVY